jgi:hypothetical protein
MSARENCLYCGRKLFEYAVANNRRFCMQSHKRKFEKKFGKPFWKTSEYKNKEQ